ncbi:MAG: TonB-dependent receptor plug domain-containing protein [Gemmatimonadetes bacterium]|nr:TonB-dependent receptor plug domain-containing protein [Gemmatimonadota bacterium]
MDRSRGRIRVAPLSLVLLASLLHAGAAAGQEVEAPIRTIVGHVVDRVTGVALPYTSVSLTHDSVRVSGVSDASGFFRLRIPNPDVYGASKQAMVTAERIGYTRLDLRVTLPDLDAISVLLELQPAPVAVDELVVTARRRARKLDRVGFSRRQRYVAGVFITAEDIAQRYFHDLGSVLRNVPGLMVLPGRAPGSTRVLVRRGQASLQPGPCPPRVLLDGIVVDGSDINALAPPIAVAGIEVYRGAASMPAEYGGAESGCGVIVIWTH